MNEQINSWKWSTFFRWSIVIVMPFFFTLLTVRLLIVWEWPSYPEFEYGRIAPDRFGFTLEERLERAQATLDYLRHSEPAEEVIYLLEALRLPDSDRPLYNEREIDHMLDVKVMADNFTIAMYVLGLVLLSDFITLMISPHTRPEGYRALKYGGILTAVILLVIGLLVLLAWNFIFVQFHQILFPPDSWTFSYSDSLIRLFPERFWFDFGLIWTGLILLQGVLAATIGHLLLKRSQPEEETPLPHQAVTEI